MSKSNAARAFPFPSGEARIEAHVLKEVIDIVTQLTGIFIGEKQMPMVENRLKSRMGKLQITDSNAYLAYLRQHRDSESQALVSLMTTHHTYFFREFNHFEFLISNGLKALVEKARKRPDKKIKIWSAACSRGQEVYSLAMFFDYHLQQMAPDVSYEIFGSDVDPESVGIARNGVYLYEELKKVPMIYMGKNWLRGTGEIAAYAKVRDGLKKHCSFDVGNLLQDHPKAKNEKYDVIFCRNVFIYFTPEQVKEISQRLLRSLDPQGFLFVGISETLNGLLNNISYVGPSVYQFKENVTPLKPSIPVGTAAIAPQSAPTMPAPVQAQPLRVLCVDDSSTILTLLKKILTPDKGFQVVATAMNGKEAAEVLKTKTVDVVTLDIHMPEMDGMTYLKTYVNPKHPPVVMLSSVNRDNADMALRALELGALDYIEKPSLANLEERSDEIRSKLKTAVVLNAKPVLSRVDKEFKRSYKIQKPETKTRVIFGGLGQKKAVTQVVNGLTPEDPPTVLVFEGAGEALGALAKELSQHTGLNISVVDGSFNPKIGEVYLADLGKTWSQVAPALQTRMNSCMVLGVPTKKVMEAVTKWQPKHLVLEDLGNTTDVNYQELKRKAHGIVPATSYLSLSEEKF